MCNSIIHCSYEVCHIAYRGNGCLNSNSGGYDLSDHGHHITADSGIIRQKGNI
jgi:hypothetical protein